MDCRAKLGMWGIRSLLWCDTTKHCHSFGETGVSFSSGVWLWFLSRPCGRLDQHVPRVWLQHRRWSAHWPSSKCEAGHRMVHFVCFIMFYLPIICQLTSATTFLRFFCEWLKLHPGTSWDSILLRNHMRYNETLPLFVKEQIMKPKLAIEWLHLDCDTFLGHHQVLDRLKLPWEFTGLFYEFCPLFASELARGWIVPLTSWAVTGTEVVPTQFAFHNRWKLIEGILAISMISSSHYPLRCIAKSNSFRKHLAHYKYECCCFCARKPYLVPGSVLIFDDFLNYPGYEDHALRAFYKFIQDCRMILLSRSVQIPPNTTWY